MTREQWHETGELQTKIIFYSLVLRLQEEYGKLKRVNIKPKKLKQMRERYRLLTMGYSEDEVKEFEKKYKDNSYSKQEQRAFIGSVLNEKLTLHEFVHKYFEFPER